MLGGKPMLQNNVERDLKAKFIEEGGILLALL